MVRKIILVVFAVVLMSSVYAQDKMTGRIFENKTTVALFGIKVENLRLDHIVVSDTGGRFAIEARIGDRLKFSGNNYKPDTVLITDLKSLTIFLVPNQNQLKEVKITNAEIKNRQPYRSTGCRALGQRNGKVSNRWKRELYWWHKVYAV